MPSACPAGTPIGLRSCEFAILTYKFDPLNYEPVVYDPDIHSSASQCIGAHEPGRTGSNDEHINSTFLDHDVDT